MKNKKPKSDVSKLFAEGWRSTDDKSFATILNDLAEGVDIPSRLTRANLIRLAGWLHRAHDKKCNDYQELRGKLLTLATQALRDSLPK